MKKFMENLEMVVVLLVSLAISLGVVILVLMGVVSMMPSSITIGLGTFVVILVVYLAAGTVILKSIFWTVVDVYSNARDYFEKEMKKA